MTSKAFNLATRAGVDGALSNRNRIINGNFDVWQRGTSLTGSGKQYLADRWYGFSVGSFTQSQQAFTPGQTDVPGEPSYFIRLGTCTDVKSLTQKVEDVRTLAGQR